MGQQITAILSDEEVMQIDSLANKENRSRSKMILTLIQEALIERAKNADA